MQTIHLRPLRKTTSSEKWNVTLFENAGVLSTVFDFFVHAMDAVLVIEADEMLAKCKVASGELFGRMQPRVVSMRDDLRRNIRNSEISFFEIFENNETKSLRDLSSSVDAWTDLKDSIAIGSVLFNWRSVMQLRTYQIYVVKPEISSEQTWTSFQDILQDFTKDFSVRIDRHHVTLTN